MKAEEDWTVQQATMRGLPPPTGPRKKAATPCRQCPKMALLKEDEWENERGLLPENEFAVYLSRLAREEQRVGVFDSAPLIRTMTVEGMGRVLDEHHAFFATWLDRLNMLQKLRVINEVATQKLGEQEARERESRQAAADAKNKRGKEF